MKIVQIFIVNILIIFFFTAFISPVFSQGMCRCYLADPSNANSCMILGDQIDNFGCDPGYQYECTVENPLAYCHPNVLQSCTCINPNISPTPRPPTPTPNLNCIQQGDNCCVCLSNSIYLDYCDSNFEAICQGDGCTCTPPSQITPPTRADLSPHPTIPPYDLCAHVPPTERDACNDCVGAVRDPNTNQLIQGTEGVYTAIGCIKNDPNVFIPSLARLIIGIAGGIALLLMLVGAFLVTTAGGDPKKVESGKSTFTSAIIGLLVVIFSAVLLQFIGVQILRLPGL